MKGKRTLLLSVTLALISLASAQESDKSMLKKLATEVAQFDHIFPQEKVYIQFDNTSYYTGETIWFKAYVVSASTLHRSESKVLYVDLIAPGGTILKTQKLPIVAGQADGSFPLLDGSTGQARDLRGVLAYPSGFYEVRAYTSAMLNHTEEAIFSRVLPVFEQPSEEGSYYTESPVIKMVDTYVEQVRPKEIKLSSVNADFYPEGGHLIIGKPNRIAFRISGNNGLGTDATLQYADATFPTIHNGMGVFTITPEEKKNKVTVIKDGKEHSFSLPEAEEEGCTMSLTQKEKSIEVSLSATEKLAGKTIGITTACRGAVTHFETAVLSETGTKASISTKDFPEGVCRITVFDTEGAIICSRSFYHRRASESPHLTVTSDVERLQPFGHAELSFTLTDEKGKPFRDRFCLSVRDTRSQGTPNTDDLRTNMLLSSDLKGLIEGPDYYFEANDEEHNTALDLLTMVQGWERYDWQTMAGVKPFEEIHRTEPGITVNGWALNHSGKEPLPGVKVLAAFVPSDKTQTERFECVTDKNGYFGFNLSDFYDLGKLTISVETEKDRLIGTNARIKFERSMLPEARAILPQETVLTGINSNTSKKGKTEVKEEDDFPVIIDDGKGYVLDEVEIEGKRKYIDYYRFKAFDVPSDVEVQLDKAEYTTDVMGYLIDKGYQAIFDPDDSTFYIDGHQVFWYVHNSKRFLNQGVYEFPQDIDTKDIKSILVFDKVMTKLSAISLSPLYTEYMQHTASTIYDGYDNGLDTSMYKNVLMVDILVKDDYEISLRRELFNLDKRLTRVAGYSSPYQFYSPTYPDGPIPGDVDYRRTLYWNPNVVTDADGHAKVEFYGNSNTVHFNVTGAGMTAGGVPYTIDTDF